jgi:hypothetical protein
VNTSIAIEGGVTVGVDAPGPSATLNAAAAAEGLSTQADLDDELRSAERDFELGDFIEVTVEQLDRCVAAGEWPWPSGASE